MPSDESLRKILSFLLRLIVLSAPVYAVIWLGLSLVPLQGTVAANSVYMLNALGIPASVNGLLITCGITPPFMFYIGPDCTGWKSMLFFFALVFASAGASMRKRALGLAAGLPLIYIGNIARIVVVVLAERVYGLQAAMLLHDWLWQAGLAALVIALWLAWLEWVSVKKHIIALAKE